MKLVNYGMLLIEHTRILQDKAVVVSIQPKPLPEDKKNAFILGETLEK